MEANEFKNMGSKIAQDEHTTVKNAKIQKSKKGIIITISREHRTGGREIGEVLAKRLGIPFYDKEISALTVKESGLSSEFIQNVSEGKLSRVYDIYFGLDPRDDARIAQQKVLYEIAEKGSCVIVGRAANYVLKGYKVRQKKICLNLLIKYILEKI